MSSRAGALRPPGDFGGSCLIGECAFDPELVVPGHSYHGLEKVGSYLLGSWRDPDGNLRRAIRIVLEDSSPIVHLFAAMPGGQLAGLIADQGRLWNGEIRIDRAGSSVMIDSVDHDDRSERFAYRHDVDRCSWSDGDVLDVGGPLVGPALQWFNTWADGACLAVTAKYRTSGTWLGVPVEGFVAHEVHYFPVGANWIVSPYGEGREFCWQHVANEYEDGTTVQGTFAFGADGWGFAMLHDEHGVLHATTDVEATATVRANGYPEEINYRFAGQSWTWRIDPQGERPLMMPGTPLGADGTCLRDGDQRRVRCSLGNSDWWTDGRAAAHIRG